MARNDPRTRLKVGVICIGVIALLLYAYFQARDFLAGPQLVILSPENGITVASTSPEIIVRGHAEHISFLTVNGLQIFTDEKGGFTRKLLLPAGYTIITIEAQDKFGRSVKKELQFIVK